MATFDDYDARGTFLSELWFSVRREAVDPAVLEATGIRVVHAQRSRFPRWFAQLYLLPEVVTKGARYADVYVISGGPHYDMATWDVKVYTCGEANGDELDHLHRQAVPGHYPHDFQRLLAAAAIAGTVEATVTAQYLARREQVSPRLEIIAPWLRSPPFGEYELPRDATWEVPGDGPLTSVRVRESHQVGAVALKVTGTVHTAISLETIDAIDQRLWSSAIAFLSTAEPRAQWE